MTITLFHVWHNDTAQLLDHKPTGSTDLTQACYDWYHAQSPKIPTLAETLACAFAAPPTPTLAERQSITAMNRNAELSNTDFTVLNDSPYTTSQKNAFVTYRQNLRDITDHADWATDPEGVLADVTDAKPNY